MSYLKYPSLINTKKHICYISIKEISEHYCALLKWYIETYPCSDIDQFIVSHVKNTTNHEMVMFHECVNSIIKGIYSSQFNPDDPSQYEDCVHYAFSYLTNRGLDYDFSQEFIHDLERSFIILLNNYCPVFFCSSLLVESSLTIVIKGTLDLIITLETIE